MNATLEQIKPETLEIIEKHAKFFGLSADEYLRSILPKSEKELALEKDSDEDFESDMLTFAEDTENLSNYNGNYSREDIYFDHD
jgi:hypothetical protein